MGLPCVSLLPGRIVVISHTWRPLVFCRPAGSLGFSLILYRKNPKLVQDCSVNEGWAQELTSDLRSFTVVRLGASSEQDFRQHELVPLGAACKTWPSFPFPFRKYFHHSKIYTMKRIP